MVMLSIPKRIIQTGKDLDLSVFEKISSVNLKLVNPDFEYLYFSDKDVVDFISNQFPEYRNIFYSFRFNIQRIDFFRYLAIYHYGGFYFDLDFFLCENLTELIGNSCVFTFERIGINQYLKRQFKIHWDIGNYAFGAAPNHPFIRAIIDNCVKSQVEPEWLNVMLKSIPSIFRRDAYVLCTTGPGLVTRTYAENPHLHSSVKILMPEDLHNRKNWNQFGKYGVHVMTSSWRRKMKNPIYRGIYNYLYLKNEINNIEKARKSHKTL
jgi:inositol phosphorylceramide mannosyltransferase catalytic subunit